MKKLIVLILMFAAFNAVAQKVDLKLKIGEAQSIAKSINDDMTRIDKTKPLPQILIDKANLLHSKVEFIKANADGGDGICLMACGAQWVVCIGEYTCGYPCTVFCMVQKDQCVLNCQSLSLNK